MPMPIEITQAPTIPAVTLSRVHAVELRINITEDQQPKAPVRLVYKLYGHDAEGVRRAGRRGRRCAGGVAGSPGVSTPPHDAWWALLHQWGQQMVQAATLGVVLPPLGHARKRWFCSEVAAAILGLSEPHIFDLRTLEAVCARFGTRVQ